MQLNLSGHHLEITPRTRDYAESKFQRIQRHFSRITQIHCILSAEKSGYKADATVHLSQGRLHADAAGRDLRATVDDLVEKLDRQVLRHKEKLHDHHAREAAHHGLS
ncbi:ribosome hibernation-promoting factor, HPF/YfiA family [Candidatus Foliamicus sp.]